MSNKTEEHIEELRINFNTKIDKFKENADNLTVKSRNFLEQVALLFLLIFIIWGSIISLVETGLEAEHIEIIAGASIAGISISIGVNIQSVMLVPIKTYLNKIFNRIKNEITEIKVIVDAKANEVIAQLNIIDEILEELKESNILSFIPKDIVAIISVHAISFTCGLIFLFPVLITIEIPLIIVEIIIGYYFSMKR